MPLGDDSEYEFASAECHICVRVGGDWPKAGSLLASNQRKPFM